MAGLIQRMRAMAPFLLLAGLVALAYGAAIDNEYVWDDRYFLVDFAWMDSLASAWRTAFSPLFMAEAYVRPLPLLTLYADNLFGVHRAAVSHGVNIALHFATASLVFLLARDAVRQMAHESQGGSKPALAAAALFAVHPALTEAVVWVSSRFDLLATLFMMAGFWLSTRDRLRDGALASGVGALFLLAAFSKELAAVFPVILVAFIVLREAARRGGPPSLKVLLHRRWKLTFGVLFFAGLAYLAVRFHVLAGSAGISRPSYDLEQWVRTCAAIARYVQLTFLPFAGNSPQHTFIWNAQRTLIDYLPHIAISVLFALSVAWLLMRRTRSGWVLAAWSVGYLLVIHLVPISIGNNVVQQRFMYLPTAVLFSLAPYMLAGIKLSHAAKRAVPAFLLVLLLAALVVVRSIVPAWKADLSLWAWARKMDPASGMARENLIWAYLDRGMYEELDREVELLSKDGISTSINAPINVGVSHHNRGDMELALSYYEMAKAKSDTATQAQRSALLNNMAGAYARLGRDQEAVDAIRKAIALDRNNHMALANLLAFCDGYTVNLAGYDEVVLRRAAERRATILRTLKEYRPGSSLAGLCPVELQKK